MTAAYDSKLGAGSSRGNADWPSSPESLAATTDPHMLPVLAEVKRLRRENARLRSLDCRTCGGAGAIEGFLLGTVKRCPACKGRGTRG